MALTERFAKSAETGGRKSPTFYDDEVISFGLQAVAKTLNLPIVVSDDFARVYGKPLQSLGLHRLRGLSAPHELFAPQVAAASIG